MTAKFSMGEAIRFGWDVVKKNFVFLLLLMVIVALIYIFAQLLPSLFEESAPILAILFGLASWVITAVVHLGVLKISLLLVDNEKPAYAELFKHFNLFIKYAVASFLYGLIVLAGLILLIVPGIIWAIKFQFFGYFIVDKNSKIIECLQKSSHITNGAKWSLFLFSLVMVLLNILGFFCLFIGLLVTIPITLIAYAYVYRKLVVLAAA